MSPMPLSDPALFLTVPVVPVLTVERARDAVPLARALLAGGLPVLEVTLRTPAALEAVRAIVAEVPDAIVGVGTVLKPADVVRAVEAGADFLVTPGTPADLALALREAGVPAIPGCATVTEAMTLSAMGFPVLKFFPAEPSGGVRWLRSVSEPLPHVRFCPTGGIDAGNAAAYLALSNVIAVGGSWVAPAQAISAGDFEAVAARARAAAALRK
jgi:2-dehydro-3-deoxyphosphogluconate aldolase/(4S)-4-hydroxy-2-oxoglutarate aldolase